jgi:hypothetical protein
MPFGSPLGNMVSEFSPRDFNILTAQVFDEERPNWDAGFARPMIEISSRSHIVPSPNAFCTNGLQSFTFIDPS